MRNVNAGEYGCGFFSFFFSSLYNIETVLLLCVACKAVQEAFGRDANFMLMD